MSQPPKIARDIFWAALDREPADRAALLDELCAGDAALRRQVELCCRSMTSRTAFWTAAYRPAVV